MKRGGGKQKGSAFERVVCKQLSLWVSHQQREDCFWRTAMSGGRATLHGATKVRQAGDITAVAPEGNELVHRYVIECKFYRDLQLVAFLLFNKGKLAGFWKVVCAEANRHGKRPMLIAQQNRLPTLVLMDYEDSHGVGRTIAWRSRSTTAWCCRIGLFSELLKTTPPCRPGS